ncbi:MAG: hypothetical protein KA444_00930 [Bacteroidia bacterium]|nr:hypothetical protein [Bacteroidia bacterium]
MKKQNYSNHRRINWLFYGFFLSLLMINLIVSFNFFNIALESGSNLYPSALLLTSSLAVLMMFVFLRYFCIKLQERIIRSEENLRHFILTGKPLDSRIRIQQILGLRYAPDSEFVDLAKDSAERQTTESEIKKSISRWRGDYHKI